MPRYLAIDYLTECSEKQFTLHFQLHLPSPQLDETFTSKIINDFRKPWLKLPNDNFLKNETSSDILKDLNKHFDCQEAEILNYLRPQLDTEEEIKISVNDVDNAYPFFDLRCLREEILLGDSRSFNEIIIEDPVININKKTKISDILPRLEQQKLQDVFKEDLDEWNELFIDVTDDLEIISDNVSPKKNEDKAKYSKMDLPNLLIQEIIQIENECDLKNDSKKEPIQIPKKIDLIDTKQQVITNQTIQIENESNQKPDSKKELIQAPEEIYLTNSQHCEQEKIKSQMTLTSSGKETDIEIVTTLSSTCSLSIDSQISVTSIEVISSPSTELISSPSTDKTTQDLNINNNIQPSPKLNPCSKFNNLDCLQTFLLVRSNENQQNECEIIEEKIHSEELENKITTTNGNESKTEIIHVSLSNEYESVIRLIETYSQPILKILSVEEGITNNFFTLSSDITCHLLNENLRKKAAINDEMQIDAKYCMILTLHGLTKARDCVIERSLECALSCLRLFQDYHDYLPRDYFDTLRRKMSDILIEFTENNIIHPKISILVSLISHCIKQQFKKKVLVIVENWPIHFELIADFIQRLADVNLNVIGQKVPDSELFKEIENFNVILTTSSVLTENFLWNLFSTVIAYEHQPINDTAFQKIRGLFPINYFGLLSETNFTCYNIETLPEQIFNAKEEQLALICSKSFLHMNDLIVHLENSLNIQLYARNYDIITKSKPPMVFADITIDERNAIILRSLNVTNDDKLFNNLINTIFLLSLKYDKCWIILHTNSDENFQQNLQNITKLFTALKIFDKKRKEFSFQILYGNDVKQLANQIHAVCETAKTQSPVWKLEEWRNRSWLTPYLTRHEKFLLCFPCINSATAQIMLSSAPLKKLLTIPLSDLISLNPQIPERFLKKFHHFCHMEFSLYKEEKINIQYSHSLKELQQTQAATVDNFAYSNSMINYQLPMKRKISSYFTTSSPSLSSFDSKPLIKYPKGAIVSTPAVINSNSSQDKCNRKPFSDLPFLLFK